MSTRFSINLSTPSPVIPLTGQTATSPPKLSVTMPRPLNSVSILCTASLTLTPSLSIFVTATITLALDLLPHFSFNAILITSFVCSLTPSSAAITNTTTSVVSHPLERIAENAACPGVSRNVTEEARSGEAKAGGTGMEKDLRGGEGWVRQAIDKR